MRALAVGFLTACLATACMAQTKPIITISFDQDLNGVTAAGVLPATPDGQPILVPGKFGQALKSGTTTGYSEYNTSLLKSDSGTVEMWVCPLDWQPAEPFFHVFFDTRGEGALYLYKYYEGTNLLMLTCRNAEGPYFSNAASLNWKPGEWHHIAGTWSTNGVRVFVDGKPATPMPTEGQVPRKLGPTFRIGDHPWHIPRTSSSLIDEVRIYDRALSVDHIAAHAQGNYDFVAPLTAEKSLLKYELDASQSALSVMLSTGGADVPDDQLRAKLAVVPKGQPLGDAPERKLAGGQVTAALPLDVSKAAQLQVVAQVLQQGKQAFELRRDLDIPDMSVWRGNKLGLEDKVLPPWTPVKVKGDVVSVWGREYDFDYGNGMKQITSGGVPLLAEPLCIQGLTGNLYSGLIGPRVATVNATGTEATVTGRLPCPNLKMLATAGYDGLIRVEVSGKSVDPLRELWVDIPLRPEVAMYRHRYGTDWDTSKITGLLPAGQGVIDRDHFIPYYWLGNNDRGLFWFCESDEMWPNGQSPDAVQVIRAGNGTVTLRLNILAKGQKLPPNWKFVFGLQATPVKPLPKNWRKWRFQPGRNGIVNIMWPTPAKDSIRYFGYPEATDPSLHAARIKQMHEQGQKAVPYLCLSFLSAACPEWPFFSKVWAMGPVDASSSDVAQYGAGFAEVSPVGKDYADFIVWKTAQFIKQYGIDGLYHDNTHPYSSTNLDAGCGYMRDGKVYPTYPIFGFRDLYRRMYAVLKSQRKETFSMAHMSGKVTIPILAYEDSILDGEHFRGRVQDSYLDMMSLDTFRTEYMGRQWGIIPYFLPEFDAERAKQVEPTRGLMALLMLHDTAIWPIWCNAAVANEALAALDAFGYVDATFTGYFDNPSPAATDMKDVYVSAYRKGKRTLLIVGNVGKEDRQGAVTLNGGYFRTVPKTAMDWPAKTPLAMAGGKIGLSVPRLGYRMVVVE